MIDLHCHVLPGIDDGPQTIEDSVAIARAAASAQTRTIVATPHVSRRYPNTAETIARLVGELNARLASDAVPVEILPGAELSIWDADRGRWRSVAINDAPRTSPAALPWAIRASGWKLTSAAMSIAVIVIADLCLRGRGIEPL